MYSLVAFALVAPQVFATAETCESTARSLLQRRTHSSLATKSLCSKSKQVLNPLFGAEEVLTNLTLPNALPGAELVLGNVTLFGYDSGMINLPDGVPTPEPFPTDHTPLPGFIHIPPNDASYIEEWGKKNGYLWGFNAIRHTGVFEKVKFPKGQICTWDVIPPATLTGVEPYIGKRLFCVVSHPVTRMFQTYLFFMKQLQNGCGFAPQDYKLLTKYAQCTPESLNSFVIEAIQRLNTTSEYEFDCNMIPQVKYVWAWDGKPICKDILRFENLPGNLEALLKKENVAMEQPETLPQTLVSGDVHEVQSEVCPGISSSDFYHTSLQAISEYYKDDFDMLGYK